MAFGERFRGYAEAMAGTLQQERIAQIVQNAVKQSLENPSVSLTEATLGSLSRSKSGASIDKESILSITAFWRAVQILSGVIASLPIDVYEVTDDSAFKLRNHPISRLIAKSPSQLCTKFDFMQTLVLHLVMYNNFYGQILRRGDGRPASIRILDPEPGRIKINETDAGNVTYRYKIDDKREIRIPAENMLHVSGLSWNGISGISIMDTFRETFGTAISSMDFVSNFYRNGAMLSGAVTVPQKLDAESYSRMKKSWKESYGGTANAGSTAILEQGATYTKIGLSPIEAGIESAKRFTVTDVSRITGVPQYLLEDLERATFNNIEELGISFRTYTLYPLCQNIQAEFSRKLLSNAEQDNYEIRIDLASLLRADSEARAKRIDALMKWGIINRDEARAEEGLNPIADGTGQDYYIPLNMVNPANPGDQLSLFGNSQTDTNANPR